MMSPDDLEGDLQMIRRELGIGRKARIAIHPDIMAPLCVGLLRPTIIWPTANNCPMNRGQRLASLTHELAHLRYRDDWVALIAELWRAVTWFYPPVHLALWRLSREREYRCDDLAAGKLETPTSICRLAAGPGAGAGRSARPPLLAATLLGETSLADHVRRIIHGEVRRATPLGRKAQAILALAAIAILGVSGSVRLVGFAARTAAQRSPMPRYRRSHPRNWPPRSAGR